MNSTLSITRWHVKRCDGGRGISPCSRLVFLRRYIYLIRSAIAKQEFSIHAWVLDFGRHREGVETHQRPNQLVRRKEGELKELSTLAPRETFSTECGLTDRKSLKPSDAFPVSASFTGQFVAAVSILSIIFAASIFTTLPLLSVSSCMVCSAMIWGVCANIFPKPQDTCVGYK